MNKLVAYLRILKSLMKDLVHIQRSGKGKTVSRFRKYCKLRFSKKMMVEEFLNYEQALKDENFSKTFLTFREACVYWKVLNPSRYAVLAKDKYMSHLLLEKANIPTPELYAYYHPEMGNSDYNSLRRDLESKKVTSCVIKPAVDGAHGTGVFVCKNIVYTPEDCILVKSNGKQLSLREFCKQNTHTSWLFESIVKQSEQIGRINRSSVNTVRFMTALYPNKRSKVFATWMKYGRVGSDVDNAGSGGNVDCAVNADTGECYNVSIFNSFADVILCDNHPDSGEKINGIRINNWDEIKMRLCEYQARIPQLKAIGWDVALTENGPVIIEINNYWDTTGQLFLGRGWRNEVKECYEAWNEYYK